MQADVWVARADRHAGLRWIGVGLFGAAAVLFVAGVGAIATGRAPLGVLPWCLVSVGLSLGSFGTNDDTALHALAELARRGAVPARHKAEWDKERKLRGSRLSTIHTHPRTSLVLPLFAAAALVVATVRVGTAWGLLS